jgi:hypothetical protein
MIAAIAMVLDFAPDHWTSGTRLVAICMGDYANSDTGKAWPSIRSVSRRTGLSERQVQRHLRIIEADGWIEGRNGNGSTLYIWVKRVRIDDRRR